MTGLIWQKVASRTTYTQPNAINYCGALSLGGSGAGWRLPTLRELQTIVDYSKGYASLMMDTTVFSGEPANWFWSSTSKALSPSNVWYVVFNAGSAFTTSISGLNYVRCVR
ncbi:MAG: DUF1566 domain-containing protein [Myxococcaceae bacterium]|nr:DUF1566 domain-containing protein [Myxococcaceae bacterium]